MRTLGFDKIAGSDFELRSICDAGLVEARHRDEAQGGASVTGGKDAESDCAE